MATTPDLYGRLFDIGGNASAPAAATPGIFGQIKRLADFVAAGSTNYTQDWYGQLQRIADAVGSSQGGHTPDIIGQLERIADGLGASTVGYTLDWYGQLSRIFDKGLAGINLSASAFTAASAQNTAIGTLSVSGGTGTYDFSLTDSAGNKVQLAGTHFVNLQAGSASSAPGAFNITVHADNGAGSTFNRTFSISATQAPANTVAPSISGSAIDGVTLTANPGTWTGYPVPVLTYQWKRAGVAIAGATNTTYVAQLADVGSALTVTVTGTNGIGSPASATSSATSVATKTTLSYSPNTSAVNGTAYTGATPSTSGGTAPYVYSETGTLPNGLSLNSSTGVISGTPTVTATFSGIVLTVTDADGVSDSSAPFSIDVSAVSSLTEGSIFPIIFV